MISETLRVPWTGLLLMTAVVLVGAAAIGVVAALVGGFVFLVVLFPILMGLAGGWLLAWAVRRGKVHQVWPAALAAVVMGVLIYCIYNAGDYLRFRRDIHEAITMEYGPQDQADIDLFIELVLEQETGQGGYPGYLLLNAQDGVTLTRTYSANGIVLRGFWYWVLFAVELGLVVFCIAEAAMKQARRPFCAACDRWYDREETLGFLPGEREEAFLTLVDEQNYHGLSENLADEAALPRLAVISQTCSECQTAPARVTLRRQSLNYKKRLVEKDVKTLDLEPSAYHALARGMF